MSLRDRTLAKKIARILVSAPGAVLALSTLTFAAAFVLIIYWTTQEQLTTLATVIGRNSQAALAFTDQASGAAVAVFFGLRLRNTIIRPLLALAAAANRVSVAQDYEIRVEQAGKDEFGALVDDFNRMLHEIQSREAQLKDYRDSLEGKVLERTAELRDAEFAALAHPQDRPQLRKRDDARRPSGHDRPGDRRPGQGPQAGGGGGGGGDAGAG